MTVQWGNITAKEILPPINGVLVSGNGATVFSGISTDSRTTKPGELFWALIGDKFDGHDFVQTAIGQGASGVVIQIDHSIEISGKIPGAQHPAIIAVDDTLKSLGDLAAWWRHQHDIRVVAITGSAGKTTTKEMTARILDMAGPALVTQGNFNNLIGLPLTLFRLDPAHETAVLEMGMNRPGEIGRLTAIADPDVGVITNVGMAHIEGVGDIQGVARAKTELIGAISSQGQVVLNGDDHLLMETADGFRRDFITFGFDKKNNISCSDIQNLGKAGSRFDLHHGGGSMKVHLNVPGAQNIMNAMAAAGACLCLDVPPDYIREGLARFKGIQGRFSILPLSGGAMLVDDTYNANPSSLKAALDAVSTMVEKGGRIILGLGEMLELGDSTVDAHREAGRMAARANAHYLVCMGDHAREMISGAVEAGMDSGSVDTADSHREMAEKLYSGIKKGDLVLLKGSRRIGLDKVVEDLKVRFLSGETR